MATVTSRRAEFDGTCQLCGRRQKLPGGTLAAHGYHVHWNTFMGTCPGSDRLPYEQSMEAITPHVQSLQRQAAALEATIEETLAQASPEKAFIQRYEKGRTVWHQCPLTIMSTWTYEGREYPTFGYTMDGRTVALHLTDSPRTLQEAATLLATQRIWEWKQDVKRLRSYVAWLEARAQAWSPQPLLPAARPIPDPNRAPRRHRRRW